MKKLVLLFMFFVLLLFSCKKKESQVINNINTNENTRYEEYSLKNIYDISGAYYRSPPQYTLVDNDIKIDYGSKRLYSIYYNSLLLDIDKIEMLQNNIYKMTFNGEGGKNEKVLIYLIIEILGRDKIKIDCFPEETNEDIPILWYRKYLNGVFYTKFAIDFTPTHIIIGVEKEFYDDENYYFQNDYFPNILLRLEPYIESKEGNEFPSDRIKIGSVVQLLEIDRSETINGITADWYLVRINTGEQGYIFSAYLDEFNDK